MRRIAILVAVALGLAAIPLIGSTPAQAAQDARLAQARLREYGSVMLSEIVEPTDTPGRAFDCASSPTPEVAILFPDKAAFIEMGENDSPQGPTNADVVRWVLPNGDGFYATIINCERVFLLSGRGPETIAIRSMDPTTVMSELIIDTRRYETRTTPPSPIESEDAHTIEVTDGLAPLDLFEILSTHGEDMVSIAPTYRGDVSVWSRGGADRIELGGGNDYVEAGQGDDTVIGGAGNDLLFGGEGADTLYGQGGDDEIVGGAGMDKAWGQGGDDVLYANGLQAPDDSSNFLRGGAGRDLLYAAAGAPGAVNVLFGNSGSDVLIGYLGRDILRGQANADELFGNEGPDLLVGGGGLDVHDGGPDRDRCVEGADQGLSEIYENCEIILN